MTPYTTAAGVRIGLLHQRPMPAIYGDALRLQAALIDKRTARPLSTLQRVACAVGRWL